MPPRENQVLIRLAEGDTIPQIAARLYVSEQTVKTHLQHIYRRLGVHNGPGAVMAGVRAGLIPV